MKSKSLHTVTLYIGTSLTVIAVFSALILKSPQFYTSFALGTWLILDYVDYRISKNSILGYFYNKEHRDAFLLFFIFATIFCFIIDYIYGVKLTKMWNWVSYNNLDFIRMFVFMNSAFVLSMYSLYRVLRGLLKRKLPERNLVSFEFRQSKKTFVYSTFAVIGIIGLILPMYILILNTRVYIEYAMFFPFLGMYLITDSITHFLNGSTITDKLIKIDNLTVLSLLFTILIAVPVTEILNLFGNEWVYVIMPFQDIKLMNIPLAVFIGWIPLVLGSISLVNMVKHLDYYHDKMKELD